MKLSTRGDYGVRVVLELSRAGEGATIRGPELAVRIAAPANYLANILNDLRTSGIIRSVRGPRGGFSVARNPSELTVGQVVRAMDGPLAPLPCASTSAYIPCPAARCTSEGECVLRGLWLDVRDAIAGVVDRVTFADLVERESRAATASWNI